MSRSDLNQSYAAFDQASTLVCVVELSSESWLAAGTVPGVKRQPKKKLLANGPDLHARIERWRAEAEKGGHPIKRIVVAVEAGRDGFWLARWLQERGIEVYVIHASSIPVPRIGVKMLVSLVDSTFGAEVHRCCVRAWRSIGAGAPEAVVG